PARRQPASTLFPYTTLFRSARELRDIAAWEHGERLAQRDGEHLDLLEVTGGNRARAVRAARIHGEERVLDAEPVVAVDREASEGDRKSTRLNSSHLVISYAV